MSPNDEHDIDDLDDIVAQFDPPPQHVHVPAPISSSSTTSTAISPPPPPPSATTPDWLSPDFAQSFEHELIKGMESLMREISGSEHQDPEHQQHAHDDDNNNPAAAAAAHPTESESESDDQKAARRQLQAAWEAMLIHELGGEAGQLSLADDHLPGTNPATAANHTPAPLPGSTTTTAFQSTILQTMEKLKKSESHLQSGPAAGSSAEAPSDGDDDADMASLEALLAQLGPLPNDLPESEEDMQKLLESMMGHLLNKDVLYDPLKELQTKLPAYMHDNASTLSEPDKTRHASQIACISQIAAVYDAPSYADTDVDASSKIAGLLTELQSLGPLPADVVGPMPPGFAPGPDGMPQVPESCCLA